LPGIVKPDPILRQVKHGLRFSDQVEADGAFPLIRAGMAELKVRSCLIDGDAV
jgi:hypothetical protein